MRIATDYRHAGLGVTLLRPDDMHDALLGIRNIKERNAEVATVLAQRLYLLASDRILDYLSASLVSGNIVVNSRDREVRATHLAARHSQTFEGLRRCHLMHQMQVDVHHGRLTFWLRNNMRIPDFLKHRLAH